MFEGFTRSRVKTRDTEINLVRGGNGPAVLLLHGYPQTHVMWHKVAPALGERFTVVAADLRGYGDSGKPPSDGGLITYCKRTTAPDQVEVMSKLGFESFHVVGHDWGGMVAWQFAMTKPEMTDRLAVLTLPHPKGLNRELANNPDQQRNSQYARAFQLPGAHKLLTAERLAGWVKGEAKRAKYIEAMKRSDFEAMLNYYKRNYPRPPYEEDTSDPVRLKMPVLLIHGLDDKALLHGALNRTWEWLDGDLTLVTIPGAGHFVHHDKPALVSRTLKMWLLRDR